MKERPILLFQGPMVRAILREKVPKTQTRSMGKIQCSDWTQLGVEYRLHATKGLEAIATYRAYPTGGTARWAICACPYGIPGDRLWVKETFCNSPDGPIYRATEADHGSNQPDDECVWKPSIFMPRKFSRITLEITAIRVERLQEITTEDCVLEGCAGGNGSIPGYHFSATPREHYRHVWRSINGKDSWEKNPWNWVISFNRLTP